MVGHVAQTQGYVLCSSAVVLSMLLNPASSRIHGTLGLNIISGGDAKLCTP